MAILPQSQIESIKTLHDIEADMPPGTRYVDPLGDVPNLLLPDGRSIVTDGILFDGWSAPAVIPGNEILGPQAGLVKPDMTAAQAIAWARGRQRGAFFRA